MKRMLESHPKLDTAVFVDGVNRSLKSGDFLLLIIGDGIRSGAESLVGFLQQYGNLRFSLGLIEVAAYRLSASEMLLQPRILARTEVLTRMVIVNEKGETVQEAPTSEEQEIENPSSDASWFAAFWTEFMGVLRLDDPTQPLAIRPPRAANYYLYLPPGSSNQVWISAYLMQSKFEAGVYITFGKAFQYSAEVYAALLDQKEDIEREFGSKLSWERNEATGKIWIASERVGYKDLNNPEDRARVISHLADVMNRMINAFRHRLVALTVDRFH